MNKRIIARKDWKNAIAFILMEENGNCSVYGKFRDERRCHPGPSTGILKTLPEELLDEAQEVDYYSTLSPELQKVVNEIWQLAKKQEPWFDYDI